MNKIIKFLLVFLTAIVIFFVGYTGVGFWHLGQKDKTDRAVFNITTAKITLDDVMGKRLPQKPDASLVNATVAGIDSNSNGIRDDVELTIFEKYPNSAKMRAGMLQYAQVLQSQLTEVYNSETLVATIRKRSLAYDCLSDIDFKKINEFQGEIENYVLNTEMRKKARENAYEYMTSYALPNDEPCDINLDSLPN